MKTDQREDSCTQMLQFMERPSDRSSLAVLEEQVEGQWLQNGTQGGSKWYKMKGAQGMVGLDPVQPCRPW